MIHRSFVLTVLSGLFVSMLSSAEPPTSPSPVSAAIKAALPKYQPILARETEHDEAAAQSPVLLPKLVVRDAKLPRFSERELHTKMGLDALLLKRYRGMSKKGDYANSPMEKINYAVQAYEDDARTSHLKDLGDFADVLDFAGDSKGSARMKTEINRSFIRRSNARSEAIEKSGNGGRR